MNRVSLIFEYDDENRAMIEGPLETFVGNCISYGVNVELKIIKESGEL